MAPLLVQTFSLLHIVPAFHLCVVASSLTPWQTASFQYMESILTFSLMKASQEENGGEGGEGGSQRALIQCDQANAGEHPA